MGNDSLHPYRGPAHVHVPGHWPPEAEPEDVSDFVGFVLFCAAVVLIFVGVVLSVGVL